MVPDFLLSSVALAKLLCFHSFHASGLDGHSPPEFLTPALVWAGGLKVFSVLHMMPLKTMNAQDTIIEYLYFLVALVQGYFYESRLHDFTVG